MGQSSWVQRPSRACKMKSRAPQKLPCLSQILAILGNPHPREIAKLLDVSERTVYGWKRADRAPRAALLALFWESSYGLETINCDLHNAAMSYKCLSDSLSRKNATLAVRIDRLEKIGSFDTANAPYLTPVLPVSASS